MPRVMERFDDHRGQDAGRFSMYVASYLSGYTDGEGCFTVSFSPRIKLRTGWEVRPSFSVSQNADRSEVLQLMLEYFGCGGIRPDRSDRTLKYEVRDLGHLLERVIPHFERYPLLSGKRGDFLRFAKVCELIRVRAHLTEPGLRTIVELALAMNISGRRKFTAERLLEHRNLKL